ncbi:MAG: T9SS type A sorting domain-containing protein [Crocinitomicaceae bacterium]|nr:T9SS type A sorting domain-containing protein [Crocinitomicaceae bacterium]
MQFINSDTGWTWGSNSTLFQTLDGGNSWNQLNGPAQELGAPAMYWKNFDTAWSASGPIQKTTDGGTNWITINDDLASGTIIFEQLFFIDDLTGWACGGDNSNGNGFILKTTDGGITWINQTLPTLNWVFDFEFNDPFNGYACAGNLVYFTTDGGTTWTNVTSAQEDLYEIEVLDPMNIWACGLLGTMIHTADGGINWTVQNTGATTILLDMEMLPTGQGLVSGYGVILTTVDFGTNWSFVENTSDMLFHGLDVTLNPSGESWVTGLFIKHSLDFGVSWTPQPVDIRRHFYDVAFSNDQNGWVVGGFGSLLRTNDQGANWYSQNATLTDHLRSIALINDSVCYVAGSNGAFITTENSGDSWQQKNTATTSDICSISFTDASNGWLAGKNGLIKHTTDGGTTWIDQTSGTTVNLNSIFFVDGSTGWVVGNEATILKTTNGGTTWTAQTTDITDLSSGFNAVFFTDANNGWAVGHGVFNPGGFGGPYTKGIVYHTTNGGTNWQAVIAPDWWQPVFYDVYFISPDTGWVVGGAYSEPGTILRTINGGQSWMVQKDSLPTHNMSLECVFFKDNIGWTAGGNDRGYSWFGNIFSTVDFGGSGYYLRTLENNYAAEINAYPNPFSANTTITFPNTNNAVHSLIGYDASGKLIFERHNITTDEVIINRDQLPAGTYIFQLIRENNFVGAIQVIID